MTDRVTKTPLPDGYVPGGMRDAHARPPRAGELEIEFVPTSYVKPARGGRADRAARKRQRQARKRARQ